MDLLQWWNLVFLLPALAALLYLLLLAFGAMPGEGHDLHPGGHVELHHDHDLAHGDGDPFHGALNLIGVGRVPLSLLLMSFGLLWGFFGWLGVQIFRGVLVTPALFIWPAAVLALIGSTVFTSVLARGLGRLMPSTESYGAGARELVGRVADVRYSLTESAGTVQTYDRLGSLHEVPARVLPGETAIPAGARVILWRFDEQAGAYLALQDEAIDALAPGTLASEHRTR
jgi:membrane protein implicated in regulation of membrane protease activity